MTQVRPEPEYFRVGFYGKGFPSSVRVRTLKKKLTYRVSLYFCIRREGRSHVCPCCAPNCWYSTNVVLGLTNQNFRIAAFDWPAQMEPIRMCVKTLSTRSNGDCGHVSSCAWPVTDTYISTWFQCPLEFCMGFHSKVLSIVLTKLHFDYHFNWCINTQRKQSSIFCCNKLFSFLFI